MRALEGGLDPGTVVGGRYEVLETIGRGGMGIVYRVVHVHTREPLALKLLHGTARVDREAIGRFKREARASARIKSDHVVRVIDADTAPELGESPYIAMELLDGTDLEKHVVENGPMRPEHAIAVLRQVARALDAAHRVGIVHRDLKPENLFLHRRSDGTTVAKILDFGISKVVGIEGLLESANMTSTGSVIGTPFYMSPEQAHGENDKIGPATDVWAMGLVAIRLLTAETYWNASSMADLMMKIAVKPIVPPSERWPSNPIMTPAVDAWFMKSLDRDRQVRFSSAIDQIEELARALGVDASSTHLPPPVDPSTRAVAPSPLAQSATPISGAETIALAATEDASSDRLPEASSESRRPTGSGRGSIVAVAAVAIIGIVGVVKLGAAPEAPIAHAPAIAPSATPTVPSASASVVVAPTPTTATSEAALPVTPPSAIASAPARPIVRVTTAKPSAASASAAPSATPSVYRPMAP